jgi:hypothetical protein
MVYVLIAVIAVMVIGGGVFAFIKLREGSTPASPPANVNAGPVKEAENKPNNNTNPAPSYDPPKPTPNANTPNEDTPTPLGNNVYKLESAGIQFQAPPSWQVQQNGDQITLAAPDQTVSILFQVVENSNVQQVKSVMDAYITSLMTNVVPDGPAKTVNLNGMTVYSQSGKGVLQGVNVEWSSEVLMASKPVLVVSFAAVGLYEKHQDEIVKFIKSIKQVK